MITLTSYCAFLAVAALVSLDIRQRPILFPRPLLWSRARLALRGEAARTSVGLN